MRGSRLDHDKPVPRTLTLYVLTRALCGRYARDRAAYDYVIINKGPWDRLKADEPFVGTAKKPAGVALYPADMTKAEREQYIAAHPAKKEELEGLFTIVRRDGTDFVGVPYHAY